MSSGTSAGHEQQADRIFRIVALSRERGLGHALLIGIAGAAVGVLVRLSLQGVYGSSPGLMLYLPGILMAALWAGRLAGFTALVLAVTSAWAFTTLPGLFVLDTAQGLVNTATFSLTSVFGIILASSLRRTLQSLVESNAALQASTSAVDEGEARFRLVSEDAPVMLWMSDEQGDCVYLNKALREFWGALTTSASSTGPPPCILKMRRMCIRSLWTPPWRDRDSRWRPAIAGMTATGASCTPTPVRAWTPKAASSA